MLTLKLARAHPTTSLQPSKSALQIQPSEFRAENEPEVSENVRTCNLSYKGHPVPFAPDRPPTQTSPTPALSWVGRHLRQKSCCKKLQLEATNLVRIERRT